MAGPYLADVASLLLSTAAVIGTSALAWAGLRLTRRTGTGQTTGSASATAPAPVTVHVTGTGGQGGRWGSRGGTGVRIDHLTIRHH